MEQEKPIPLHFCFPLPTYLPDAESSAHGELYFYFTQKLSLEIHDSHVQTLSARAHY